MTLNDLNEGLRIAGCFDINSVAYAIVETNGNISVLMKSPYSPITANNMGIKVDNEKLQVMLICEGKIVEENIDYLKISKKNIENTLKKEKISQDDVLILATSDKKNAYLQAKYGKCKMIKLEGDK